MDVDLKENIAKIIENKLKQIKTQAEFYENKIKTEIKRIIEIEEKIKRLRENLNKKNEEKGSSCEIEKDQEILESEMKLLEIKKVIRDLRTEKKKVMECDVSIQFRDDLSIKSPDII